MKTLKKKFLHVIYFLLNAFLKWSFICVTYILYIIQSILEINVFNMQKRKENLKNEMNRITCSRFGNVLKTLLHYSKCDLVPVKQEQGFSSEVYFGVGCSLIWYHQLWFGCCILQIAEQKENISTQQTTATS